MLLVHMHAQVFDVPLATFVNSTGHSYRDLSWQGHRYRIHLFEVEEQPIVWGLTAGILIQVGGSLAGAS
jgi:hypothetical protein